MPPDLALRTAIIDAALTVAREKLSPGTTGNVSARLDENGAMLITPTGVPYDSLTPEAIVPVAADGTSPPDALLPSSEWHFHLAIYQARAEVGGIVHTHSDFATAIACTGRSIPAFHYMVSRVGGDDIRCAPYATFGTPELGAGAVAALEGRRACLLANHGQIATGESVNAALAMAFEVETLAAQYWRALMIGNVTLLDETEMQRVGEKFKTYGRQRSLTRPGDL